MTPLRGAALLLGLALHAAALALLFRGAPAPWLILAHLAGAVVWGFGAAPFFPSAHHTAWWQPAAWASAFPIVGPLASLAFAAILRRAAIDRTAQRYIVWSEESHALEPATHRPGGSGQSIVDILQSPRTQLRRNAILALRDLDPQLAIPLLRKGLQDSDEQVRIYAQNILSSILERFDSVIKHLEEHLQAAPADHATARRLAEQYFELVYLDVAGDDETAAHYLDRARALLERVAAANPDDFGIPFLGLRYALRARDAETARRWVSRLRPEDMEAQHVIPWLMELAFLEGDWRRLRALFAGFRRTGMINRRIEELCAFWLGEATPAAR